MENIDPLKTIRQEINKTDEEIVKLLDKRFEIVKTVVAVKKQLGIPIFQKEREKEVISKVGNISKNSKESQNIFKKIINETKKFEEKL